MCSMPPGSRTLKIGEPGMKRRRRRSQKSKKSLITIVVTVVIVTSLATAIVTGLLVDIFEHKAEARSPFYRVTEIDDSTQDPIIWGKNFPFQYDGYLKTVDMVRTRFGGSESIPRAPTKADPRSWVSHSRLQEDPRLKTMWSGYSFAIDFREERGHAYMLEDQTFTRRHEKPMPGTCIHCHASVYVPYKKLGNGDLFAGFEKMNQLPYMEARQHIEYPITCIDCHDPTTLQLRVTRPGFLEGIKATKKKEGIEFYDVNKMASRQEMRTFVCAQCHVEYYFKGKENHLVYPWSRGLVADDILAYYEEIEFNDWTHGETGAPMLKVQHPEFEMWSQGIHSRAGVSCADCHMPYIRVGGLKVSDHHVRSPLLNINNSCQTCHQVPEMELKARTENIQEKTFEMRDLAMNALLELISDIKKEREKDKSDKKLTKARDFHRKAQFMLDFVEAENSMGFHAPQEAARILAKSIDYSRKGQVVLRDSFTR